MNIEQQLKQLLKWGEGETFYSFANEDGKRWWMPVRHMSVAMNLYQPSGIKGKCLKRGLPWLYWNPIVRIVLHTERFQLALGDNLRELLENIFKERDLEFSVFGGTPSARQKITIQLSKKNQILGYCKVTHNDKIYDLFKKESNTLNKLNRLSVLNVPQSLFCGAFGDCFLFIQSTKKTCHSKIIHTWTDKHTDFLNGLYDKTKVNTNFKNTDFYSELCYLESISNKLSKEEGELYSHAISLLKSYYSNVNEYSLFHGDFTPWNMFFEKKELCVFDFEYAQWTFPPFLDKMHYLFQIWIIEQKKNSDQIYQILEDCKQDKTVIILVIAYLTHIIAFYMKLYNGQFDTHDNGYIIWSSLLQKYISLF